MDSSSGVSHFLGLVADCTRAADPEQVVKSALRTLPILCDAEAAVLVRRQRDDLVVEAHEGTLLPTDDVTGLERDEVPSAWRATGIGWVQGHPLPGHAGVLVLAWRERPSHPHPLLEAALGVLDAALARTHVEAEYHDLVARVDNAQHLANMGDYDWHIASDTNRWSDQLYRIYGHEPQSFNASYDRFLKMVHPDDRERIVGVHQEAYRTGEPYHMIERIVRPDGEVRHIASNGQVLMGPDGAPLRFRGTCIDITERVLAEHEREEIGARMVEHRLRQRQALEINDNVVQGLVAASYALELEDLEQAASHLDGTLAAARGMMDDLLDAREGEGPAAGDLVRSTPATFGADDTVTPPADEQR